jgi:hypothetical protein
MFLVTVGLDHSLPPLVPTVILFNTNTQKYCIALGH